MSLFSAWIVYPLVLALLCGGLGLLVDAISGRRLPGTLIAPLGLAAMVVVGVVTTLTETTASLTMPLLVALAVVGLILAFPWRFGRPDYWAAGAALAVFAVFAAPVVLSGEPTFAGYIKLDDTATWFAITDRLMDHGRDLTGLAPSSYEATLDFNLADWYPIGAFIPFGVGHKIVGGDLAWEFQPYLALLAAFTALPLYRLLRRVTASAPLRAAAVFIAAQAALLFSYALWGGIKELIVAALVGLAAALAPAVIEEGEDGPRGLTPLAIACAALVGVLSFGAAPWLAGLLGAIAVLIGLRYGLASVLAPAGWFLLLFLPLAALGFVGHPIFPEQSGVLQSGSSDLGNLSGPISPFHILGIWPAHDFRLDFQRPALSTALIALAAAAALYGAWRALRDRDSGLLVLLAGAVIGCAALALFGSAWIAAKAYASVSPFALLLAAAGLIALARVKAVDALVIAAAIVLAAGVIWSNALGYGGAALAPYGQLDELAQIGKRFAGDGPALMTDYSPYGARHFLRKLDGEGASELRRSAVLLADGTQLDKAENADLDRFALSTLFGYKALVVRRSPAESRPPSNFALAYRGRYYDVWLQRPDAPQPLEHLPLGSVVDPSAVPDCAEVQRLADVAGPGGSLLAAATDNPIALSLGDASVSGDLQSSSAGSSYLEPRRPRLLLDRCHDRSPGALRGLAGRLYPPLGVSIYRRAPYLDRASRAEHGRSLCLSRRRPPPARRACDRGQGRRRGPASGQFGIGRPDRPIAGQQAK